jgi:putative glutamine amidotransferase
MTLDSVRAPVVGITTYRADARWGVWQLPAALTPWAYVNALTLAGGAPLLLPPAPSHVDELVERIDGLIVCGGPDISPQLYGSPTADDCQPSDDLRDTHEFRLIGAAMAAGVPMLGVCRGMQMLNVVCGGTLHQHLPTASAHAAGPGVFASHSVMTAPGSRLREILGPSSNVRSYHHQGVATIGSNLVATVAAEDGTVEGLEHQTSPFAIGVLWHPEMGDDLSIFESLVDAARSRRDLEPPASG